MCVCVYVCVCVCVCAAAKPDYDEGPLCIGESGDIAHKGVGVIMILSLTLFLLAVRSIT